MEERSRTTRRRFLLSASTLAVGYGLAGANVALTQELAPTPACHDRDEPTVRQSEGHSSSRAPPSAVTCASLAPAGVGSNCRGLF